YLIPFYREYVAVLEQQHKDLDALRVIESSRARVLAERLGGQYHAERIGDVKTLQQFAGKANASLLSFWCSEGRSYAWLITAKGMRRFDLPPVEQIEKLVTDY